MRALIFVVFLAVTSCGSPPQAPQDRVDETGASERGTPSFALNREALVGLWSFDRSCGNYDLVFGADGEVQHYAISEAGMTTSYAGTWSVDGERRVVMQLRVLDSEGRPSGDELTYDLDLSAPAGDDLTGAFGAEGETAAAINARRCPDEDRD